MNCKQERANILFHPPMYSSTSSSSTSSITTRTSSWQQREIFMAEKSGNQIVLRPLPSFLRHPQLCFFPHVQTNPRNSARPQFGPIGERTKSTCEELTTGRSWSKIVGNNLREIFSMLKWAHFASETLMSQQSMTRYCEHNDEQGFVDCCNILQSNSLRPLEPKFGLHLLHKSH
jgi:hypothetical protein